MSTQDQPTEQYRVVARPDGEPPFVGQPCDTLAEAARIYRAHRGLMRDTGMNGSVAIERRTLTYSPWEMRAQEDV